MDAGPADGSGGFAFHNDGAGSRGATSRGKLPGRWRAAGRERNRRCGGRECHRARNHTKRRWEFERLPVAIAGEILHAEGGYLHDLRSIKFADSGEGLWRRAWAMKLNGNLYPTHGLGPVANCLDINRGDRFDHMVSMSGPARGLQDWAAAHP